MRIVLLHGDKVIRDQTFDDGPIAIGSAAAAGGMHLPHLGLALEHARLVVNPAGQWMLETASPSARTLINNQEVQQRCRVHNGDEIVIGGFRLKLAVDGNCDLGVAGPSSLDELARIKDHPLPPGGEVRHADPPIAISLERQRFLAGLARALADCGDIETLMDHTLETMLEVFSPRMAWLGVRRQPIGHLDIVEGRTADGPTMREPQALASLEYRCLERSQSLLLARKKSLNQESGLAVPLEGRRGRLGLLYVEAKPEEHRYGAHHLDLLLAIASHVACRVEDVLVGAVRELAEADADRGAWLRAVQRRLNPSSVPRWEGYQLAIFSKPGRDSGGDVYDCITMPNTMTSLLVANVRADSLGAAVLMPQVRAAFRVGGMHADPPRVLLQELNWLAQGPSSAESVCAAHVVMNPKTGAIEYCTAGPIGALIVNAQGAPRTLTDPQADRLGTSRAVEFPRRSDRLGPGELLALYSPGCRTMSDPQGEAMGDQRFVEALCDGFGVSPVDLLEELQQDLAGFFKRGRQPDDITILLLYRS